MSCIALYSFIHLYIYFIYLSILEFRVDSPRLLIGVYHGTADEHPSCTHIPPTLLESNLKALFLQELKPGSWIKPWFCTGSPIFRCKCWDIRASQPTWSRMGVVYTEYQKSRRCNIRESNTHPHLAHWRVEERYTLLRDDTAASHIKAIHLSIMWTGLDFTNES